MNSPRTLQNEQARAETQAAYRHHAAKQDRINRGVLLFGTFFAIFLLRVAAALLDMVWRQLHR